MHPTHCTVPCVTQVEEYARHLPTPLAALPGGGIHQGSIVVVEDQEQHFQAQLLVEHVVRWVVWGVHARSWACWASTAHRSPLALPCPLQVGLDPQAYPEGFMLSGDLPAAQAPPAEEAAAAAPEPAGQAGTAARSVQLREAEDGVVLLESDEDGAAPGGEQ